MILALVLGLAMGLPLGLLGGGGSILAVPLLAYGLHLAPQQAVAGSLLAVALAAALGAAGHHRQGNVAGRTALLLGGAAAVGSALGAQVGSALPGRAQLVLFALVAGVAAVAMLRGRATPAERPREPRTAAVALGGLGVGLLTGVVGVGGGFLFVPLLAVVLGLSMHRAVGTSLAVIALGATGGFLGYLGAVDLDLWVVAPFALAGAVGARLGSRLAGRVPAQRLRRGFAWALLSFSLIMLAHEVAPSLATPPRALPQGVRSS